MLQRLPRRPSTATLIALVALFVALGGPAEAARLIGGAQIKNRSITTVDLNRGTIRYLRATPARSVRTAQIVDGQVLSRDLASAAVTGDKLAAGAIGAGHLAAGAVTASKLGPGSVSGASIADGTLQTVDVGSFAGSVQVDFTPFTGPSCQFALATPTPATQPLPNIADDVVLVTPPVGWPDSLVVTGVPAAGNQLRVVVCNVVAGPVTPPAGSIFRYVTFDAP